MSEELPVIPNDEAHIIRLIKNDSSLADNPSISGIVRWYDYEIRVKIDGKYYNGYLELSE